MDTTLKTLTRNGLIHYISMVTPCVDEIHIFSLEGCIQKGFPERLENFRNIISAEKKSDEARKVKAIRSRMILIPDLLSHATLFFISVSLVLSMIFFGIMNNPAASGRDISEGFPFNFVPRVGNITPEIPRNHPGYVRLVSFSSLSFMKLKSY